MRNPHGLIGDAAMTAAQRQQRRRDKLHALRPAPSPDLLTLDAEVIAARIRRACRRRRRTESPLR